MKIEEFFQITKDLPVIEVELLLAGVPNPDPFKVQISRWEKAGKLIQLKRGVYLLSRPYRKIEPYEPYIASILMKPSYVSMEKALEFYDLIPEAVRVYTSITTKRPAEYVTQAGRFSYNHVKSSLFWGYKPVTLRHQTGFIATPEKALLDLLYFHGLKITAGYLDGLRLQHLEQINLKILIAYAKQFKKPGMLRAAKVIKKYIESHKAEEKTL